MSFLTKLKNWVSPRQAGDVSDRSPYGSFWFDTIARLTGSGVRVNAQSALQLSTVYACVKVLAESFAILPIVVYQIDKNGLRVPNNNHWLVRLFKRPNDYQTSFQFREMILLHLALRGNFFAEIITNARGEITTLLPIHPDAVRIEILNNGNYRYLVDQSDGSQKVLPRGQIWHIRGMSDDGIVGLNPIETARENIGVGLAAQSYGSRFYQNDARPGGWIEFPGQFKNEEAKKVFRDGWQKLQGGKNRGKAAVLDMGMKYHELSINNADAQFIETRKYQIAEICRLFRVPLHKIQDLDRATNNNIEHVSLEFWTDTMLPWCERIEASIEFDLILDTDVIDLEFDFTRLLRGDSASRSSYYHNGILDGWLTRNEARAFENLVPLPGLDEPLRPLSMTPESEAKSTLLGQSKKSTTQQIDVAENEAAAVPDRRLAALAASIAVRIARKEQGAISKADGHAALAQFYAGHADYVAGSLNLSRQTALEYCASQLSGQFNFDETVSRLMKMGIEP